MGSLNQIVNVNIALNTTSVPRGVFGVPMIITLLPPMTDIPEPIPSYYNYEVAHVRSYYNYEAAQQDELPKNVLLALRAVFSQTPRPMLCKVGFINIEGINTINNLSPKDIISGLNAIQAEDPNWYGFALTERTTELQLAAAEWAETQDKIFFTAIEPQIFIDPAQKDDTLSHFAAKNYLRTAVIVDKHAANQYLEMAWMGRCFTIAAGGETWALKRLTGVKSSNWTATEQHTITSKGGNTFEQFAPQIHLTTPGKTVNGEWIDVVRFRDWLANHIQNNLASMIINRNKIPYTDGGIALIVNNITGSLLEGQRVGGIAPDEIDINGNNIKGFVINYPRSIDVSAQDKASRTLQLSFSARLAGAIHLTQINGNLSYELQ